MGFLNSLFRKAVAFYPQPDDVKMRALAPATGPGCYCFAAQYEGKKFGELQLHDEVQDKECDAWKYLEQLVEEAAARRSREFAPGLVMPPEMWSRIIELPPSIARLKSVRRLYLYSSYLVRLPTEIGEMTNLRELDVYTSYCLHWLPYEVVRCRKLSRSRASTRVLYGNYKYRPPFPRLGPDLSVGPLVSACSVCARPFSGARPIQVWISLRVATDVFPLLVNACSQECIQWLPAPEEEYVNHPHTGGLDLKQPPTQTEKILAERGIRKEITC